ncbi:hypothetical protein BCD67_01420 [Oscillatoriales cyanobacterium USR001]|nr:hypothetical protein BCD67_01420 [Oscillatoriales cyanobacterium USR001]
MKSYDINLFFVPFEFICELLLEVDIDFNWGEKEKEKAKSAWDKYNDLSNDKKKSIGKKMIALIEEDLISLIGNILDESII